MNFYVGSLMSTFGCKPLYFQANMNETVIGIVLALMVGILSTGTSGGEETRR